MKQRGFTLIEVLLALAVIAIALTALLKATSQNTILTNRIKDKSIAHWVAMRGLASIQLGLVSIVPNQETTEVMTYNQRRWYWRALVLSTPVEHMQQIRIQVSQKEASGFSPPLIGYRYIQ